MCVCVSSRDGVGQGGVDGSGQALSASAQAYSEYAEWCSDTARDTEFAIKTATSEKAKLEAKLGQVTANIEAPPRERGSRQHAASLGAPRRAGSEGGGVVGGAGIGGIGKLVGSSSLLACKRPGRVSSDPWSLEFGRGLDADARPVTFSGLQRHQPLSRSQADLFSWAFRLEPLDWEQACSRSSSRSGSSARAIVPPRV